MPFHEITEPGPSQICVWIARGLDKLGPCDLEKIVEYNKIEYCPLRSHSIYGSLAGTLA